MDPTTRRTTTRPIGGRIQRLSPHPDNPTSTQGTSPPQGTCGAATVEAPVPQGLLVFGSREEQLRMHLPRTVASRYRSERQERSVPTETTRRSLQVLQTRISNTHFSKQPRQRNGAVRRTEGHCGVYDPRNEPPEQGRKPIWAKSTTRNTGNAGKGPLRGLVEHLHGMKVVRTRPTPQGFDPTPGHQVMERQVKQLEIGGRTYEILEDPRTAPIK